MQPRRESYAPGKRYKPIHRQDSFFSPITSQRPNSSSRSSLVRSPDRMESDKNMKRRRLSLLPNSTIDLGAPVLVHRKPPPPPPQQNLYHRQSNTNNHDLNTRHLLNTPSSSIRNTATQSSIHEIVQGAVNRTNTSMRRDNRRDSTIPPSSAGNNNSSIPRYMSTKAQDPRPIRSHKFQNKVQTELYEYLLSSNYNIEMTTLKNPTQKDFESIFKWFYNKLDPGYKFEKSFNNEVSMLLKYLEYPYLETINKSQITAVGSNWPVFLGMLHWLLQLVKKSIKFDDLDLDSIQESQLSNNNHKQKSDYNDSVISSEQTVLNKLFISYALKSYKSFLSFGEDDYSTFYDEMQLEYKQYIEEIQNKYDLNFEINENLKNTLNLLTEEYNLFHEELHRSNALRSDVTKFKNYIDIQKQRQTKWSSIIEKANSDINNIKESIKTSNKEKQDIELDLSKKQLTLKDIEGLHKERAELTAALNSLDSDQKKVKDLIDNDRLKFLRNQFIELKSNIFNYNKLVYHILNSLNLSTSFDSKLLAIDSINDELQTSKFGLSSNEIIPIISTVRTSLSELKKTLQSQFSRIQDDTFRSQKELDDLKLSIVTSTDKLEELEDTLSKLKNEYTELDAKYLTDSSNLQIEIEEKSKEIRLFKLQNNEKKKSIENKWKDTQRDYKRIIANIHEQKSQLVCDIAKSLDDVISFKSDIMSNLENALVEVKQEIKNHINNESNDV